MRLQSLAVLALLASSVQSAVADTMVLPDNENILYMGRIDRANPEAYRFTYPGTAAIFNFEGESLKMAAKPGSGRFVVEIDSKEPFTVNFTAADSLITLADKLDKGAHSARVTYAIEGYELLPEFRGFILGGDSRILDAPERPDLKIEFIGNSITCGYGIEDNDPTHDFSYDTENHCLTYAYKTARALNADVNVVARSGIGIYRNFGTPREGSDHTMPDEYDRTMLYAAEPLWDHNEFKPDVICINLGTNDTSLDTYDMALYEASYRRFIDHLRELHPETRIVLLTGCMMSGHQLADVKGALDRIAKDYKNVYRFDMSPQTGELGYGAAYHPSIRQADKMAEELTGFLRTILPKRMAHIGPRHNVPVDSIVLSDPCVLADKATATYYMTGTGGLLWKSKDLKLWDGPYRVVEHDTASWMGNRPDIWAAELHHYGDKYYYFATFTNNDTIIDRVDGRDIPRRASHVLVSDRPDGPYRPVSEADYLPESKPTLDGTFWVDSDGKPYMIFCHEWLQNLNGTIEKIELTPDMATTKGESVILFRASDSPWSREINDGKPGPNRVTDGPWLFRTGTGRLGMIWTSWVMSDYTQGVAYSESGTLDGPWIQEAEPITPPNYGHGMLFRDLQGRTLMAVHSHKDINGFYLRHPTFWEVDLTGDKLRIVKRIIP